MAMMDEQPQCPLFLLFLEKTVKTDAEIDILQEFFGYCLWKPSKFKNFLVLSGPRGMPGAVVVWLLEEMAEAENCARVSPEDLADPGGRAGLEGRRINISHADDPFVLVSPPVIAAVDGEAVSVKAEDGNTRIFKPDCRFIFTTGDLPLDLRRNEAFKRRAQVVRFHALLRGLAERFPAEKLAEELPAIREWAELGLKRLRIHHGFTRSLPRMPDCARYADCLDKAAFNDTEFDCSLCTDYRGMELNYEYYPLRDDPTYYLSYGSETIPRAEKAVR